MPARVDPTAWTAPTSGDPKRDAKQAARFKQAQRDRFRGRPNIDNYDPRPAYLRSLLLASNLSQTQAAKRLGLTTRTLRYYLSDTDPRPAPYLVQFALEALNQAPRR